MKAKRITALLAALTLTAAFSACGKKNIELAQSGMKSETESKVLKETETETKSETELATEPESVTEAEPATQPATELVTEPPTEPVTEPATQPPTERVTEPPTEPATQSAETNQHSGSSSVPVSNPVPAAVDTHTHSWKEHTATEQVWVPNIVVVDDYEEQTKEIFYDVCSCGFRVDNDYGGVLMEEHMKTSMLEAARNGTINECPCGRSLTYTDYVTETVKVGSHEEEIGRAHV